MQILPESVLVLRVGTQPFSNFALSRSPALVQHQPRRRVLCRRAVILDFGSDSSWRIAATCDLDRELEGVVVIASPMTDAADASALRKSDKDPPPKESLGARVGLAYDAIRRQLG
jgi:hypothetical protein